MINDENLNARQYTITYPEELRELCIKNNWFTCGDSKQYEKLFYANEKIRFPLEHIATIIWLCSNNEKRGNILDKLKKAQDKYLSEIGEFDK